MKVLKVVRLLNDHFGRKSIYALFMGIFILFFIILACQSQLEIAQDVGRFRSGPSPDESSTPSVPPSPTPQTNINFFAFGDWGTGNSDQMKVATGVEKYCDRSKCDFGILAGDNFYPSGVQSVSDPQFKEKFEDVYKNIFTPFFVTLGNHDYGNGWGSGKFQIEYSKISKNWIFPKEYYSFVKSNVVFIFIDTQTISENYQNFVQLQGDFVKTTLSKVSDIQNTWIIVVGHFPYFTNGEHTDANSNLKGFFKDHLCGFADFYIAGHDHNLQLLPVDECSNMKQIVSGGGGAGLYSVSSQKHPFLWQRQSFGFVGIQINGNEFDMTFYDENADVLYHNKFSK